MFVRGLKKEVGINDLYKCPNSDESEELVMTLERYFSNSFIIVVLCIIQILYYIYVIRNWSKELKKRNPSFLRANLKTFILQMLPPFSLFFFEVIIESVFIEIHELTS